MPRRPLTHAEVAATRRELLDAATGLYEDGGFDAMSFRAIADAAGCSHTKPYRYFDSKADLIDHLRIDAYDWLRDLLTVAASTEEDPIDALQALSEAYVRSGVANPRRYELLYTDRGRMGEDEPRLMRSKLAALAVCENVIQAAIDDGRVTFDHDAATTAHLLWTAGHGLVALHTGGFFVVGRSVEQLTSTLFASVLAGTSDFRETS